MNTVKLRSGLLSAKLSIKEAKEIAEFPFGLQESALSGMICEIGGLPELYTQGISSGDKLFILGVDNDGDSVVLLFKEGKPLVQYVYTSELEIL